MARCLGASGKFMKMNERVNDLKSSWKMVQVLENCVKSD